MVTDMGGPVSIAGASQNECFALPDADTVANDEQIKGLRDSLTEDKKTCTLANSELTPEGLWKSAIDMLVTIAGREPTAEELAELDARMAAKKAKQDSAD
tara:strand:- start:678 stop:977 length:300 start_codon:yes stop_codon:yes gene_type:complete